MVLQDVIVHASQSFIFSAHSLSKCFYLFIWLFGLMSLIMECEVVPCENRNSHHIKRIIPSRVGNVCYNVLNSVWFLNERMNGVTVTSATVLQPVLCSKSNTFSFGAYSTYFTTCILLPPVCTQLAYLPSVQPSTPYIVCIVYSAVCILMYYLYTYCIFKRALICYFSFCHLPVLPR